LVAVVSLCAGYPDRDLTVLSHYNTAGVVVAQTNQHRRSDNDHIVCFFTAAVALDCNCDLLQ
jgi:hypothetical protein